VGVAEEAEMTEISKDKSNFDLKILADLIRVRNSTEMAITRIIGRPAQIGHIGEYIASNIFDIQLEVSAVNPGSDGYFNSGPLAGKSVNIKMYGKREGFLDINIKYLPDYYLVLTGPKTTQSSSKGQTRPWLVSEIFLFEAASLVERLKERGIKFSVATSVVMKEWDTARIYPTWKGAPLVVSEEQEGSIGLFGET